MKKILFILTIVISLFATSCEKQSLPTSGNLDNCFYIEAAMSNTVVSISQNSAGPVLNLQYSTDKSNWQPFVLNETSVTLANEGERIYLRAVGENKTFCNFELQDDVRCFSHHTLNTQGRTFKVGGNIMYLLDENGKKNTFNADNNNVFAFLFSETNVIDASDLILPANALTPLCYYNMFEGCKKLEEAPQLPATVLAESCYESMFQGCNALKTAPQLPATTLAPSCYICMFYHCSGLLNAPALPATTLADNCYEAMFFDCSSLQTAPALPATKLADNCYDCMFKLCGKLTSAPALPATTLAYCCYSSMFAFCKSLKTAPALPATTLTTGCYDCMFLECTSLESINVSFTQWGAGGNNTIRWVEKVPSEGTFTCSWQLDDTKRGIDYIPEGWTVVAE